MRIEVEFHPGGEERTVELPPKSSGTDLVKALGLAPDAHILVRDETPIPEDEALRAGDRIRIIAVVSGG